MAHPIRQSSENSPYGDMTREQFYEKHQIHHQESFMVNSRNMSIFTQSWRPDNGQLKGLVAMVHGYISQSSWLFELNAVALAKSGFHVFALDLQGHGYSQGKTDHIPDIDPVVADCIQFFDSARARYPKLPAFLYGESLGGAIGILICMRQKTEWRGLVLSGAMCGVSAKLKPIWPIEELLPIAAYLAPFWRIVITRPLASKSYRGKWQRRLINKGPNRRASGKPRAATALELMRVCEYVKRNCHKLQVPLLVLHGEADVVCDSTSARFVYESASSQDKTLKIFPGMWHQLIGESKDDVELVFQITVSWISERANKDGIISHTTKI